MFLRSCLNPVKVTLHGEEHFVPCGKCELCKARLGYERSLRIQLISSVYKYCVFGTLTYSDLFLPKMLCNFDKRFLYVPNSDEFVYSNNTSEIGDVYKDLFFSPKDEFYMRTVQDKLGYLPRLSRTDIKLYFKRLRTTINREYSSYCDNFKYLKHNLSNIPVYEPIKISISYCGEYGPSTYRPHFHFLLFFNNPWLAKNLQILSSCWSYGRCDFKFTSDANHLRYVAQYVNSSYSLPSCYECRKIRPFTVVSKINSSFFSQISKDTLRELFIRRTPQMSVRFRDQVGFKTFLLLPAVKNRLYPQFSGYSFLSFRERVELLEFAACSFSYETLVYSFSDYRYKYPYSFITSYFEYFYKPSEKICSAIYDLFLCARKIVANMHLFCINSIREYVSIIDTYLANCDSFNLKNQLIYESTLPANLVKYLDMSVYTNNDISLVLNRVNELKSSRLRNHKNKRKNEYLSLHSEYNYIRDYDDFSETFTNNLLENINYE